MIWRRGNYGENTAEMILDQIKYGGYFDGDSRWYAGVTANAVQSLTAHGFTKEEIYGRGWELMCWDIRREDALRCKKEAVALYNMQSDDESDFLSETLPNLYIYFFQVTDNRETHIDTSGFTPAKTLPEVPIWVTEKARDGSVKRELYDHKLSADEQKELLEHFREVFLNGTMNTLVIQHRSGEEMWFNFGEGCCRISYDAHTSQEGGYASWRNGSKARKPVPFFEGEYPAYMVCTDVEQYMAALSYFLEKDRKPGKRQNVQWAWINEDKFPKNK